MATVLAVLVLAGVALYLMTPEERTRLGRAALAAAGRALRAAMDRSPSGEPLDELLHARTRWAIVTPLIVSVNALIFLRMVVDAGAVGDPQTQVAWGANIALRTTNGDWWRLLASTFVHGGFIHLLATMAGLVPLGLVLERALGPVAFLTTYLAAGIAGSVVSLWTTSALRVSAGASAAVFGVYGLLLAVVAWCIVCRPTVPIPVITVKRVGVATAVFCLYNLVTGHLTTTSELAGLATGFASGLTIARGVALARPPVHRAALVMAAAVVIAIAGAIPMRGIADVAPAIAHVVTVEEQTAGAYDAAVVKYRRRRIPVEALITMIDGTILPELQVTRARLKSLQRVPPEHVALVAAADEYVHLREQSWRRRAAGLLQSDTRMLREAEETERAALVALRKIRPAG